MSKLSELGGLIRSMTKSEKRYFIVQNGNTKSEKAYLYLFELLVDNDDVSGKFVTKFPENDLEMARKHLLKVVLKSLRSYEDENTIEVKLMNSYQNTSILFNKGAYNLCFDELNKGIELALTFEKQLFSVLFSMLKLELLTHFSYTLTDENELLRIRNEAVIMLEKNINSIKHGSLYHMLMYRYIQQGNTRINTEQDQLNDLLLEEYQLMSTARNNSFEAEKNHLLFQSAYFLMTANASANEKVARELNQLFVNNEKLWQDSPEHFFYMTDGMLSEMYLSNSFNEMTIIIDSLIELTISKESKYVLNKAIIVNYQLLISYQLNDSISLKNWLMVAENELRSKFHLIPSMIRIKLIYTLSLVWFGLKQYKKSLREINQLFNDKSSYISFQTRSLSRILYLFIHLELENLELVLYDIRSFERILKKEKKTFELEKICIHFFKKYITTISKKDVALALRQELIALNDKPIEERLLKQLPIMKWLKERHGL